MEIEMERDHLFAQKVKAQAEKLGYKVIYVDGKNQLKRILKQLLNIFN